MVRKDRFNKDVSLSYTVVAATDYSTASSKITGVAGWTIFVKKITVCVTTDNAATQLFQDSSSTPILVATTKVSPGLVSITFDFGERGFALTAGKDFQHKMSAAGIAASVTVDAYMAQTAAVAGTGVTGV